MPGIDLLVDVMYDDYMRFTYITVKLEVDFNSRKMLPQLHSGFIMV